MVLCSLRELGLALLVKTHILREIVDCFLDILHLFFLLSVLAPEKGVKSRPNRFEVLDLLSPQLARSLKTLVHLLDIGSERVARDLGELLSTLQSKL